jgi:SAM-dependent methyltransferase
VIGSAFGHPGVRYASTPLPGPALLRDADQTARSADDARIYDRMITLKTEAQWRTDLNVLVRSPEWLAATTVLDLGAGTGAFGRRLAAHFPTKSIVALEPDAALHALGSRAPAPPNYAYLHGGFDPGLEGFFDVLLARTVLNYMPDRRSLATWASEHCSAALVMNNDQHGSSMSPALPSYLELLSRASWSNPVDAQAVARDRDRELVDAPRVFADAGFTLTGSHTAVTELVGARGRLLAHHLLRAAAELVDPAALTMDMLDELFEWSNDDDAWLTLGATWYCFRNTPTSWLTLAATSPSR